MIHWVILAHILAVGGESDLAGLVQGAQPHDGGHQLHPVVGGEAKTAGELLAVLAIDHDGTIAARARVAETGTIRIQIDLFSMSLGVN